MRRCVHVEAVRKSVFTFQGFASASHFGTLEDVLMLNGLSATYGDVVLFPGNLISIKTFAAFSSER